MTTTTYYTTHGPVRGTCGHRHRETRTALACLERDRAGCRAASSDYYSDRKLVRVPDGSAPGDLTRDGIRSSDPYVQVEDRPQYVDEYDASRGMV